MQLCSDYKSAKIVGGINCRGALDCTFNSYRLYNSGLIDELIDYWKSEIYF